MRIVCAVFILAWTLTARAADTASQIDPRALIFNAIATHQPRVVIPPGIYRLGPAKNAGVILNIRDASNLEIVADGVTLICTQRVRALLFEHCEKTILRGLTVDYDPLTFTQGRVVAIADDLSSLDIRLDAGYPQVLNERIVICNPKTCFHKFGINHTWGTKASWAQPGVVRITLKGVAKNVDLGDPVALSGGADGGAPHAISIEQKCSDITLDHVTLHCAPGMGIIESGSDIGVKILNCKIVPGPKPLGATEERLLTTSWDGIQCQAARVGARVEDCVIERCGNDTWSAPDKNVHDPDCRSRGFVFRNNRVYSHGRGALVKVSDGLIEGNVFRGSDKAIVVNPETAGDTGPCDNLIIRNNVIRETGYHQAMPWSDQAGALCLSHGLQAKATFHHILIESNTFDSVKGLNLFISSAQDVIVKDNRFINPHSTDPGRHNGADRKIDATAVIVVSQSEDVRFSGNEIDKMGAFGRHAVVVDPTAKNVTGVESGIHVGEVPPK